MFRCGSLLRSLPRSRPLSRPLSRQAQCRFYRAGPRPRYQRFQSASNIFTRWAARPTFYREVAVMSGTAGGFYLYNLEEVPVSGRRRFNIIGPDLEVSLAQGTMEEIKLEFQGKFLPEWDPRVRQVHRVMDRLLPFAQKAGLENVNWEIHVIDNPQANAFVIPGGKVFVFTGILPLCKNEDGIAAVLSHEIAHVVAHHTAEKMSQAPLVMAGALLLWTFDLSFYTSKTLMDLFMSLPGSRRQESEADYIGLLMMAEGCYSPEAAMEFWARMEHAEQGAQPPQLLSTHPAHHNRQEKIREWLPKAHEKQELSDCQGMASYCKCSSRTFIQPA
ncbi:mitochondrial metalloendopeptidase OMA1 [Clohesyomyces aquaticus]|uniref:Mitochondrial metalloendopeptidase OMA1 n=1 Tax=Clohesyomyces aquaticus TaxID=1231657 RepID=A0A1Y1ZKD9_9PLEO|nr:mitochondrial metalloendopeptidase OMA1 [Clohesyomyces aquaticus]